MTIYVFGDPMLLREVLLALSTIFNLVDWNDAGSAFGLGGNFLAMALIGLTAIAIAGVTSQQVRVDYLFVALLLFAVMFAAKTNVNVEDIQTGDAAVVADVPIGIAVIASASSSAARSLTETVEVALQRPGSETSLLTADGFMDPLRTVLRISSTDPADLDSYLYRSMMEFYRICIGRTREMNPGTFEMDDFLNDPAPLTFMTTNANFVNYSTIYYDDANPGGVAMSCVNAAAAIRARAEAIADGTSGELEAYLRRAMGSKLYNTDFEQADIDDAVDILFRGSLSGQEFMSSVFVRNLYNEMEALAQAEYGTNTTQYVAQVTQAFEEKSLGAAIEGTTFLNYMFPMMTFFQFLFFAIAPFIALIMVASPFTSGKLLGSYLLFGVWAYSWMPVAAIINHYMEISLQNNLEYAGVLISGTGYTAILGFDDFYNIVKTKLAIGSQALAATPVIVGAILSATVFAISNLSKGMAKAGNADRTDTSMLRPRLAQNGPLVNTGGRASFAAGTVSSSGDSGAVSDAQKAAYEQLGFRNAGQTIQSAGASAVKTASSEFSSAVTSGAETIRSLTKDVGLSESLRQNFSTARSDAISQALNKEFGNDFTSGLSGSQRNSLIGSLGARLFGTGAEEATESSFFNERRYSDIAKVMEGQKASITAETLSGMAADAEVSDKQASAFREAASNIQRTSNELETAISAQEESRSMASSLSDLGTSSLVNTTDLVGLAVRRNGEFGALAKMNSALASFGSDYISKVEAGAQKKFNLNKPIGMDGIADDQMDNKDRLAGALYYLSDQAAMGKDPKAAMALLAVTNALTGVGGSGGIEARMATIEALSEADGSAQSQGVFDKVGGAIPGNDPTQRMQEINREADRNENDAINDGPRIGDRNSAAVSGQASVNQAAGGNRSELSGLSPELAGAKASAAREYDMMGQGASTESRPSEKFVDLLKAGKGFNQEVYSMMGELLEADGRLASTDQLAQDAIWRLNGQLSAIGYNDNGLNDAFAKYKDMGFSPKQAALAAYGELGARTLGASDYLVAGLMGAAGERGAAAYGGAKGMTNSALSLARTGGAATGVGLFAAGVGLAYWNDVKNAEDAARVLGEDLKNDFRQVNPEAYEKFAYEIDRQTSIEGMTAVLQEYYRTGDLNDQMIDEFKPQEQYATNPMVFPTAPGMIPRYTTFTPDPNPFSSENAYKKE